MEQSNMQIFHHQLVSRCFYIYYIQFVHVSALYRGHIQGVTSLVDVQESTSINL